MVNRPLLFVKSPPAYFKEIEELSIERSEAADVDEVGYIEEIGEVEKLNVVAEETKTVLESSEWQKRKEKLMFLSNPFQQKVYQPLVFIVNDGRKISGEVYDVNTEKQEVLIRSSENIQSIPIESLEDLLWRGKSFLDN